jgi:hypothetical protein
VLVGLVGAFIWGYLRASGRPPTAFQYVPRELGPNDSIQLNAGSTGVALWLTGEIQELTIDRVSGSTGLKISLPLRDCSKTVSKGPLKCPAEQVELGGFPLTFHWSQPVTFCMERDAASLSLIGDPTLDQGLLVSVSSAHTPADRSAQTGDCLPQSGAGDMCFETLPSGRGWLRITHTTQQTVWSFRTSAVPPGGCAAGRLKMLVRPGPFRSTTQFELPAQPFRLIATAPTGVFRSRKASVLTPAGRVALDPGDAIRVRRAHGLCAVVISDGGSPAPLPSGESTCETYSRSLANGLYVSSPAVVNATRELRALSGPGEQLVKTRYEQDPALWLALLGAYLTVVVTLVPTLGHRAYVELWRGWSSLRPKRSAKRPPKKRGGLS